MFLPFQNFNFVVVVDVAETKADMFTKNGVLFTPQESSFGIYYATKSGHTRKANISGKNNKYVAIFEEDDVDFFLRVNNCNNIGRDLAYYVTLANDEYALCTFFDLQSDVEALVSRGKHLHFISESSRDGKRLVRKMATKLSINPDRAAGIMSQLKFSLVYSMRDRTNNYIEIRCYDVSRPFCEVIIVCSTDTISDLKQRFIRMGHLTADKKFEFYYDQTLDIIDDSIHISEMEQKTVKIIFTESIHREPFNVSFRNEEDGTILFDLEVTSDKSIVELKNEILQRSPGNRSSRDVRQVKLSWGRNILDNDNGYLIDYGATSAIVIDYCIGTIQIFCKTLDGQTHTLECFRTDRVGRLKHLIQGKEDIPVDQQRLIFGGTQLDDGKTLSHYNVENQSTIQLVPRIRGGGLNNAVIGSYSVDESIIEPSSDEEDTTTERGLVCFGERIRFKYEESEFVEDPKIVVPQFSIELRLARVGAKTNEWFK